MDFTEIQYESVMIHDNQEKPAHTSVSTVYDNVLMIVGEGLHHLSSHYMHMLLGLRVNH